MNSVTHETPRSEQSGSESLAKYREVLQVAVDLGLHHRIVALAASRPAGAEDGTVRVRQEPDGTIGVSWTAPLSEWLSMLPKGGAS